MASFDVSPPPLIASRPIRRVKSHQNSSGKVQFLLWKEDYTTKDLQVQAHMYWQESEEHARKWTLRVLDQGR